MMSAMARLLLALVLATVASGCSSPVSPGRDLAGTWAEAFSIPGASLVLTVDGSGSGSGTYAIEAGRSGLVQVAGQVSGSTITLVIRYDYGTVLTFTGSLADSTHLSGRFDGDTGTVTFTRK